jgi:hypothetical protein
VKKRLCQLFKKASIVAGEGVFVYGNEEWKSIHFCLILDYVAEIL